MAYKKKTPVAPPVVLSALEEMKMEPLHIYAEEERRRITETPEFHAAMERYARDLQSIPALLADILKESVATRLILERTYGKM